MKVGVIKNDLFGELLVKTLEDYDGYEVHSLTLQDRFPPLIENPQEYIQERELFKDANLIISCVFDESPRGRIARPELTTYVAELCGKYGKDLFAPRAETVFKKKYENVVIAAPEIGCELRRYEDGYLAKYTQKFGRPEYEVELRNGRIEKVSVKRCSPCGASFYVADKMTKEDVDKAPKRASILASIYPCTAPRGFEITTAVMRGRRQRGQKRMGYQHLEAMKRATEKEIKAEKI